MKVMIEGKEYWRDAKGNLTPAELVKEIDKARDALVHEWVERGRDLSKAISHFKEGIFGDVQAFIELSAEKYGAKVGGNKPCLAMTVNTKFSAPSMKVCSLTNVFRLPKY